MKFIKRFLGLLTTTLFALAGCNAPEAESIGIIGGADGPTAIFVTSTIGKPAVLAFFILLSAAILAGIVLLILRHIRRK